MNMLTYIKNHLQLRWWERKKKKELKRKEKRELKFLKKYYEEKKSGQVVDFEIGKYYDKIRREHIPTYDTILVIHNYVCLVSLVDIGRDTGSYMENAKFEVVSLLDKPPIYSYESFDDFYDSYKDLILLLHDKYEEIYTSEINVHRYRIQ